MNLKTKQTLAILFSIGGAIGTVGTALLARKATMKEIDIRKNLKDFDQLSTKEKAVVIGKIYIPTAAIGAVTVGSIIGSSVMSHKAQASLMSMAVLADQGWRKYKNQVKATLGLDSHADVLKGISKNALTNEQRSKLDDDESLELYFEETVGFFQAKPEDVMYAYATINEMMNTDLGTFSNGVYERPTIAKFLELANAKLVAGSKIDESLGSWGWTMDYLHDITGTCWIHMGFSNEVTDDGVVPYKVITWVEEPIFITVDAEHHEKLDLKFDDTNIEYVDLDMFRASKDKEYE